MASHNRIIIIGGGIVGVSTLYHLARAGEPEPLLLERRDLTAGATWHAAGNVHTQSAFANLSALQAYSLDLYRALEDEVDQPVGCHVVGGFFLAQTRERMGEFRHLAGKFRALGIAYELVTPGEIKAKHPLLRTDDLLGGAWDPDEGYVDPYSVTMALAAAARRRGGRIRRNTCVDGITRLPSGAWCLTAGEEVFECEIVVNCAGFWANEVAGMVGARVPVTNMEHQYLVTDTIPEMASHSGGLPMVRDADSQYYVREEGPGLLLGPWEVDCRAAWNGASAPWTLGQELFPDDLERLDDRLSAAFHRIPTLKRAGIRRTVNGAISFAPDGRPIVGPIPGIPNFYVACGFLGGIAQGGGVGLALGQWILHGEPELSLNCIDVARFGDWATGEFARNRTYEIYPARYEVSYPGLERTTGRDLRVTPIHGELVARGAVMGQAYGWERPLWYAPKGIDAVDEPSFRRPNWWDHVGNEAVALATGCGLTELSSYAKFRIAGRDAYTFLDRVLSAGVPRKEGRIGLSLLLSPRGGIVGDVTVLHAGRKFYLVGATLAAGIYHRWLQDNAGVMDVKIEDVTDARTVLGVAGPGSRALLNELSGDAFEDFPFLSAREVELGGVSVTALRISYSGELGWELHGSATHQKRLFDILIGETEKHQLVPVGSRAMGMLRLEKGYRSWDAELTTEITPHAAGLERFCSTGKEYIGRTAVDRERRRPPSRRLRTLEIDPLAPPCWGNEPILRDGRVIGHVTSGGMGWRTGKMLAVGWMESAGIRTGSRVDVEVLCRHYQGTVLRDPVYDPTNQALLQ